MKFSICSSMALVDVTLDIFLLTMSKVKSLSVAGMSSLMQEFNIMKNIRAVTGPDILLNM